MKIIQITQTSLGITGIDEKGDLYVWSHSTKGWVKQ